MNEERVYSNQGTKKKKASDYIDNQRLSLVLFYNFAVRTEDEP